MLDPLLFLVYVNDKCNSSDDLEFLLLADDANGSISGYNIGELYSMLNNELKNVTNWCKANVLTLNVKKLYILFHKARKKNHSLIITFILVISLYLALTTVNFSGFL